MATMIGGTQAQWGYALEATIGTPVDPTAGLPLVNKVPIKANPTWITTPKATGRTVRVLEELKIGEHAPGWAPQMVATYPEIGLWQALCTQSVSEAGAGPYVQTVVTPTTSSRRVTNGTARSIAEQSVTLWETIGQSSSRDISMAGAIVKELEIDFPETGEVTVTPTFMATEYDNDDDGSGGVYTLPSTTVGLMTSDFVCKVGDTPAALYSKSWNIKLVGNWVAKRYGGWNDLYPYIMVCDSWTVEATFSKPILANSNRMAEDYVVDGGGVGSDFLLYIYSKSLTDYNESSATWSNGEMEWTLNLHIDEPDMDYTDEAVEMITAHGIADGTMGGTNNAWKFEQATTASQAWAVA